jgi:hypothetical protein
MGSALAVALSRSWALGAWVWMLFDVSKDMLKLGLRMRWAELRPAEWVGLFAIVLGMAYCEGYKAFQKQFSPMLVKRTLAITADSPWYVHLLGPFYVGGFFDGTPRRLVVSWLLVVVIALLGIFTARCPHPWRQSIDLGVFVGLGWGVAAIFYWSYRAYAGTLPHIDPQFARRLPETAGGFTELSEQKA